MRVAIFLLLIAAFVWFLGMRLIADRQAYRYTQEEASPVSRGESGLPIPRFISLKTDKTNVRKGPGRIYDIAWVFNRKKWPLEIIAEFGHWRKIRDSQGMEGWIFHSLLSSQRTAIVTPWRKEGVIPLREKERMNSKILAQLEPGVHVEVLSCNGQWCYLTVEHMSGWVEQSELWGVYPREIIR